MEPFICYTVVEIGFVSVEGRLRQKLGTMATKQLIPDALDWWRRDRDFRLTVSVFYRAGLLATAVLHCNRLNGHRHTGTLMVTGTHGVWTVAVYAEVRLVPVQSATTGSPFNTVFIPTCSCARGVASRKLISSKPAAALILH